MLWKRKPREWGRREQDSKPRSWKRVAIEWAKSLALAAAVVLPVKSSLADWYDVPTGSMEPTIIVGDRIFVNKLAYGLRIPFTDSWLARWGKPSRGDIVVCASPESGIRLVKRVIGLPGDTIELRENVLRLNGTAISYSEPAGRPEALAEVTSPGAHDLAQENLWGKPHIVMGTADVGSMETFGPVTIPDGMYFVMGDNRDLSRDSRYFGCVPEWSIVGRSSTVVFSLDKRAGWRVRTPRFFKEIR